MEGFSKRSVKATNWYHGTWFDYFVYAPVHVIHFKNAGLMHATKQFILP